MTDSDFFWALEPIAEKVRVSEGLVLTEWIMPMSNMIDRRM